MDVAREEARKNKMFNSALSIIENGRIEDRVILELMKRKTIRQKIKLILK